MTRTTVAALFCCAAAWAAPLAAQEMPAEYQQALSSLGKQGDFKEKVLKVNIPRNRI